MQRDISIIDSLIKWFVHGMLVFVFLIVGVAMFSRNNEGEANIGSFESEGFNTGWIMERNGERESLSLPSSIKANDGDLIIIRNQLPVDITDGSSLLTRASLEDYYIYINGELREQYATESIPHMSYYLPSSYLVAELSEEDSGAEIEMHIRVKSIGVINEIRIGHGNNAWFGIIKNELPVNIVALMVLVLGIILAVVAFTMTRMEWNAIAAQNLGFLMIDMAIWVFSESGLRQLFFLRPSMSQYFAYLSLELLGILACMYFDEVQHRKYHVRYRVVEACSAIQLTVNILLHFFGVMDLYKTLVFSHLWMAVGLVLAIVNIVSDIRNHSIKNYKATAFGMVGFLLMATLELVAFYASEFHVFGIFVCSGLIVLMVATVVQALLDQVRQAREREQHQTEILVNTIETIAGSIDAKDEYTGGHSERVGRYAAILARGMAADYDFTEEDILRINYIGLMHDIGKIGVADTVLNKVGKLSESEFSLMKKHVDIGADLLEGLDGTIMGLTDGIRYHHERFDGKGYPEGLSDTDIPLIARILCLADSYDAMTSNRVYRKRLTDDELREEFRRQAGTQFDPALTEIMVRLLEQGVLKPYTVDGMAVADDGKVQKSALLENHLQNLTLSEKADVKNPSHIRMLCYIMKLKEKRGGSVNVYFLPLDEGDSDAFENKRNMVRPYLNPQDVVLEYLVNTCIVTLFDRSEEEWKDFEDCLTTDGLDYYLL